MAEKHNFFLTPEGTIFSGLVSLQNPDSITTDHNIFFVAVPTNTLRESNFPGTDWETDFLPCTVCNYFPRTCYFSGLPIPGPSRAYA
jgi:hypothetical protein